MAEIEPLAGRALPQWRESVWPSPGGRSAPLAAAAMAACSRTGACGSGACMAEIEPLIGQRIGAVRPEMRMGLPGSGPKLAWIRLGRPMSSPCTTWIAPSSSQRMSRR